jgi:hypothetical protein
VVQEHKNIQSTPASARELLRTRMQLVRCIPINESSIVQIARGLMGQREFGLPLDKPTVAAGLDIKLTGAQLEFMRVKCGSGRGLPGLP